MKITLLVDDCPVPGLQQEFGLSMLLESAADSWLFDCGANTALPVNLAKLDISPEKYAKVILSHGHYDHTGGLKNLTPSLIYCTCDIDQEHYSFHAADDIHNISMPAAAVQVLRSSRVQFISELTMIAPGIYLTGPIERKSFEDPGGRFFHDAACTEPDLVNEEQLLLTDSGVLITGCCHVGIINALEHCHQQCPHIKIHTIVGGLHLRNASKLRLQKTAEYLYKYGIKKLYMLHCSGNNAVLELKKLLPQTEIITPEPGAQWEV